jgi:hypothetical protein
MLIGIAPTSSRNKLNTASRIKGLGERKKMIEIQEIQVPRGTPDANSEEFTKKFKNYTRGVGGFLVKKQKQKTKEK